MKNKKTLIAILAVIVVLAAVLLIWHPWNKPAETVLPEAVQTVEEAAATVEEKTEEAAAAVEETVEEAKDKIPEPGKIRHPGKLRLYGGEQPESLLVHGGNHHREKSHIKRKAHTRRIF